MDPGENECDTPDLNSWGNVNVKWVLDEAKIHGKMEIRDFKNQVAKQ